MIPLCRSCRKRRSSNRRWPTGSSLCWRRSAARSWRKTSRDLIALPDEQVDLERGRLFLARYAYPSLDVQAYQRQLDHMAQDVREQIGSRVSGEETVKALNRYLFTEAGFKGNTKNYYEVENSYLNCVIDRRTGIPSVYRPSTC